MFASNTPIDGIAADLRRFIDRLQGPHPSADYSQYIHDYTQFYRLLLCC